MQAQEHPYYYQHQQLQQQYLRMIQRSRAFFKNISSSVPSTTFIGMDDSSVPTVPACNTPTISRKGLLGSTSFFQAAPVSDEEISQMWI